MGINCKSFNTIRKATLRVSISSRSYKQTDNLGTNAYTRHDHPFVLSTRLVWLSEIAAAAGTFTTWEADLPIVGLNRRLLRITPRWSSGKTGIYLDATVGAHT